MRNFFKFFNIKKTNNVILEHVIEGFLKGCSWGEFFVGLLMGGFLFGHGVLASCLPRREDQPLLVGMGCPPNSPGVEH